MGCNQSLGVWVWVLLHRRTPTAHNLRTESVTVEKQCTESPQVVGHTTGTERQTYAGFPLSLVPDRLSHNTSSYFTATFPTNLLTPHRKSHSLPNAIITATAIPPPLNLELLLLLPHGCHVNRFSCCFHSHQQFHHVFFPPWLVFVHVWAHYSIPGRFITLAFLPFPMPKTLPHHRVLAATPTSRHWLVRCTIDK